MQIYEWLLIGAGAVGALTSLIAFGAKVVTLIKKCVDFFKNLQAQIDVIEEHCRENHMRELQLTIVSEEMPIEERLRAGDEYVNKMHGNGAVKAKYRVLLQKYEEEQQQAEN